MCAEWWQTRPCIKDRSVGHVSTAGWIMLQSLHCIHLYAALCYLPPILLLLSHCHTGYWATHLVVTQAPRDWPLDVVTVRYSYSHDTEVRWWVVTHCCPMISQVSSQFQENMIRAYSHRWFLRHWKHVSGRGICEIPRESPLLWWLVGV